MCGRSTTKLGRVSWFLRVSANAKCTAMTLSVGRLHMRLEQVRCTQRDANRTPPGSRVGIRSLELVENLTVLQNAALLPFPQLCTILIYTRARHEAPLGEDQAVHTPRDPPGLVFFREGPQQVRHIAALFRCSRQLAERRQQQSCLEAERRLHSFRPQRESQYCPCYGCSFCCFVLKVDPCSPRVFTLRLGHTPLDSTQQAGQVLRCTPAAYVPVFAPAALEHA